MTQIGTISPGHWEQEGIDTEGIFYIPKASGFEPHHQM